MARTTDGRLRAGVLIRLGGSVYRVAHVNASRAHCVPADRKLVEVHTATGDVRRFSATAGHPIDISPYSLVERVRGAA